MSSLKKRFSLAIAAVLGITAMSAVLAGDPGPAFVDQQVLKFDRMNQLNTAISDNNTRIGVLETNVNNLKNGTPACPTGMTAVGPACIDVARQGPSIAWKDALETCRAANKRLPTAGELVAAYLSGAVTDQADDTAEFVDAIGASASGGKLRAGYVGINLSGLGSPGTGVLQSNLDANYDQQYTFIYFRCAR